MTDDNSFTSTPRSELPKVPESYWLDSVTLPEFGPLREDISVDAVVVGGGITGVTTALVGAFNINAPRSALQRNSVPNRMMWHAILIRPLSLR